jgi:ubiquinone/menaquinone biosynthesis C-methylase UbiE
MDSDVKDAVRDKYASIARKRPQRSSGDEVALAQAFGYSDGELDSIPDEANLGVSCGNPTAMASLRPGEVVVDLGSGGGLDVFLAARKVGSSGKSIGIDMTLEMIALANKNLSRSSFDNVEFHLAEIEAMPLETESVDCVISNCVLNLVPDKARAFSEIARILKPGGRLAVSDIALHKIPPPEREQSVRALTGCVAGAILTSTYTELLEEAGFTSIEITDSKQNLNIYRDLRAADVDGITSNASSACSGDANAVPQDLDFDVHEYAASVRVLAIK